jgi:hypothetical protein
MAGRDGKKQARKASAGRRLLVGVGAGAGVFLAAAAMATGSAVTAAPAHADFEDLLDPIIQPLLTSLTDSVAAFDPAAALDLTSWSDSFLASLGSADLALPAAAEPAASAASSAEPAATLSNVYIPITIAEDTEPTVGATVDGASTTLLVDTGSSGLVVPLTDLDGGSTNFLTELEALYSLGSPTSFGEGGYSGGVDYYYLDYNEPVAYTTSAGSVGEATVPIEVEVYSYDPSDFTSLFTNDAFQTFDADNGVTGVLGIGTTGTGGVGESPIEAAGYQGVTVDLPADKLILDATPNTTGTALTATGSNVSLTESVNGGTPVAVSDDLDSGGVYGTIPSSLLSSSQIDTVDGTEVVAPGNTITVYDNGTPLYSYPTGTDSDGTVTGPTLISGTGIDSGVIPFLQYPISIDYSNNDLYLQ